MKWDKPTLHGVLKQFDLRAMKAMGQNFLMDMDVVQEIARLSGADKQAVVIEIGPGLGVLTAALAARAGAVLSFEIDKRLLPVLKHTLADCPNVEVQLQDALKVDFAAILQESYPSLRPLVCANLPYHITTPLLTTLLTPACFEQVTVMVQKEVAERLTAAADTAAYGAFSLYVQNRCDAEIVLQVPSDCFEPRPKVDSAVVTFTRVPMRCDHPKFERVVRASFAQRRKTILNSLTAGLGIPRGDIEASLVSCGISPTCRGETLSLPQFASLTLALYPSYTKS